MGKYITYGRESPTRAALSLVFDWCDVSCSSPVKCIWCL